MTSEDALNFILSNSCSNPSETIQGAFVYRIELCCKAIEVCAIPGEFSEEKQVAEHQIVWIKKED